MKTFKKSVVVLALIALGGVAAYAACADTITLDMGGKSYSCTYIGQMPNGLCTYGYCKEIKKPGGLE